jgi:hypothetical protein
MQEIYDLIDFSGSMFERLPQQSMRWLFLLSFGVG